MDSTSVRRGHGTHRRDGLAGALGAAAALVAIELASLADATGVSVTEAVENRFIDGFAASLKDVAVALFGTGDKAALGIGTAVVCVALGALLGRFAADRPLAVAGTFGAFAVVGVAASAADPLASAPLGLVSAVLGAVVGTVVTLALHRWWSVPHAPSWSSGDRGEPQLVPRRTVLVGGAATAAALVVAGAAGRAVRDSMRQAAESVRRVLPAPRRRVPVPDQPFAVDGLSPYITPTRDFYRIDTALRVPVVDADRWRLRIEGMVDHPLSLTYDDLLARPLVEVPITLQCVSNEVGGDLVGTARWTGVPLADLLREAGLQDGATQVIGESVDGFTAGFPTAAALDGRDALVAVGMNGEALPSRHGFPARLVVPGLYGYVSATKWLLAVRLTGWDDEDGYWIPRGWSKRGPIKTQSRIDVPRNGAEVRAGRVAVAGVAWAPHRGVEGVQVRVDGGPWQDAHLGRVASEDTWVQWTWPWDAGAGRHTLEVRAIDGNGQAQTARTQLPAPDGATGHHAVAVDVRA